MSPSVRPPSPKDQRLFVKDIAAHKGVSVSQARRYLIQLEEEHPEAVGRIGAGKKCPQRYTTRAALERIDPAMVTSISELTARQDAMEAEILDLKRRMLDVNARLADILRSRDRA